MLFPFPERDAVEVAAVAILEILRSNPHIKNHSLKHFHVKDQMRLARRAARSALYAVWMKGGDGAIDALARQVAERANELIEAGERDELQASLPEKPRRRVPWARACQDLEAHSRLKAKYSPKK